MQLFLKAFLSKYVFNIEGGKIVTFPKVVSVRLQHRIRFHHKF